MPEHTIHLETAPETPDLLPQISELRERLARVEERTLHSVADPSAAASLSLASEAHQAAGALAERVKNLEEKSASLVRQVDNEAEATAREVADIAPPAEVPSTPLAPEPHSEAAASQEHHPWWNPMRYL